MELHENHHRTLLAAQGYSELGMHDEALAEVASLPAAAQKHPAAVEIRLIVLMQAKRWRDALKIGRQLIQAAPDRNIGYIHTAYCLHELGRTDEARSLLREGPRTLESEAVYHYNLACYECCLGDLEGARVHLERSVQLDRKFRDYAKDDPDLAPLHV
jgi:tetratricopeptide (TPR) repeat protein